MLKHLLTAKCNRACEYCISRNVKHKQVADIQKVAEVYRSFAPRTQLMLTGGEPSMAEWFTSIVISAHSHFNELYITTQNPELVKWQPINKLFNAITFSIHDYEIPEVETENKVYASILDERYCPELVEELVQKGYAGLTINEEHRGKTVFDETQLPNIPDYMFPIRVNRRGKCLNEPMIMPDLTVIDNFQEYL